MFTLFRSSERIWEKEGWRSCLKSDHHQKSQRAGLSSGATSSWKPPSPCLTWASVMAVTTLSRIYSLLIRCCKGP